MWVTQPEVTLILSDRPSFELKRVRVWFRPLELTFSNNSPGQWVTLHMQEKSEFLQLLLKNNSKVTDFTASVSEVVIFHNIYVFFSIFDQIKSPLMSRRNVF